MVALSQRHDGNDDGSEVQVLTVDGGSSAYSFFFFFLHKWSSGCFVTNSYSVADQLALEEHIFQKLGL